MHALRIRTLIVGFAIMLALIGQGASAHPHTVTTGNGDTQEIANGQVHSGFGVVDGMAKSCGGDPAAYGLETAHHGPDDGTPGKGDGCYANEEYHVSSSGTVIPDDNNPAIN